MAVPLLDSAAHLTGHGNQFRQFSGLSSLSKLCEERRLKEALDFGQQRVVPLLKNDAYLLLQVCSGRKDGKAGKMLQLLMTHNGIDSIAVLGDHIIRLFGSCDLGIEAGRSFDRVTHPTCHTWNAILLVYANLGHPAPLLELHYRMELSTLACDKYSYLAILKLCLLLFYGRLIHEHIIQKKLQDDVFVVSALVDMYAKCGSLEEARRTFDELPNPNVVSWNTIIDAYVKYKMLSEARKLFDEAPNRDVVSWSIMIAGYVQHSENLLALKCFDTMQQKGINPDKIAFLSVLEACSNIGAITEGRHIHEHISRSGFQCDVSIGSTLVDMYAKCGSLEEACFVFDRLLHKNVVSWSAMVAGYVENGEGLLALECFKTMQQIGIKPDRVMYVTALKACGTIGALLNGVFIHQEVVELGFELDPIVCTTLIDMYAKCGSLEETCRIFFTSPNSNIIAWNAMITGCAQHGRADLALQFFWDLQHTKNELNDVTFLGIISACSFAGLVDEACWYFKYLERCETVLPNVLHCNCMVDLFGRMGWYREAEDVLKKNMGSDTIGWITLLNACSIHGNKELGKLCFEKIAVSDSMYSPGYVLMSNFYANTEIEEALK